MVLLTYYYRLAYKMIMIGNSYHNHSKAVRVRPHLSASVRPPTREWREKFPTKVSDTSRANPTGHGTCQIMWGFLSSSASLFFSFVYYFPFLFFSFIYVTFITVLPWTPQVMAHAKPCGNFNPVGTLLSFFLPLLGSHRSWHMPNHVRFSFI